MQNWKSPTLGLSLHLLCLHENNGLNMGYIIRLSFRFTSKFPVHPSDCPWVFHVDTQEQCALGVAMTIPNLFTVHSLTVPETPWDTLQQGMLDAMQDYNSNHLKTMQNLLLLELLVATKPCDMTCQLKIRNCFTPWHTRVV